MNPQKKISIRDQLYNRFNELGYTDSENFFKLYVNKPEIFNKLLNDKWVMYSKTMTNPSTGEVSRIYCLCEIRTIKSNLSQIHELICQP